MGKLKEIYRQNIYGVMGTLIFHIVLFLLFILAEVDMKGNVHEEELLIEFPDVIPEIEEVEEVEQEQQENVPAEQQNAPSQNTRTNRASNQLAQENEFFDEEYLNEVEAAKKLVSDVNNQLAKKAVDLDEIDMPVETTEGMDPDSLKNKSYKGESNIVYYLENRYHLRLPIPVYLAQGGGTIVVDIVVNRQGKVISAEPQKNRGVRDEQIYLYAKAAATRTVFNADAAAPVNQKGTIHYTFIAQ
ncbi:MAG TPA: hypothetical protein VKA10_01665 [Prolixibacteraceae bacterium]|nr:hypothetical protein [Prolixibacteraceae bacterium]